jgi:hypothetical protein
MMRNYYCRSVYFYSRISVQAEELEKVGMSVRAMPVDNV